MPKDFKEYCEELYQNWKNDEHFFDEFSRNFKTDYLPEPYYVVKDGENLLYVLNNNPGDVLEEQLKSKFDKIPSYEEAAKKMAEFYSSNDIGNATKRIDNMINFAEKRKFDGVFNVETFFLHSKSFDKTSFLKKYYKNGEGSELVIEYLKNLQTFLKDKPALAVTAVGSQNSITKESLENDCWVQLMCKTINLDLEKADLKPTSKKDGKVTSALLIDNENNKYMTLMMGSNNIPSNAL